MTIDDNNIIEHNSVNHPAHYSGKHECIEIMRVMFGDEAVKAFCRCNSFKYRFRADRKNGAASRHQPRRAAAGNWEKHQRQHAQRHHAGCGRYAGRTA